MNVIVIAPHMDDEALGCGGTICKHINRNDVVSVIFVAHRIYNHRFDESKNTLQMEHANEAKDVLRYKDAFFLDLPDERLDVAVQDIIIPLENLIDEIKPETVYIPFRGDNNQDHRAVFDALRVVLRPVATPFIKSVCMYEVPSSTDQSPPLVENAFLPNYYVDISPFIDRKLMAYKCYKNEKRSLPHPRSEEAIRILASRRGIESGFNAAESFMILREKWE